MAGWEGLAFRIAGFPERWEPYTALAACAWCQGTGADDGAQCDECEGSGLSPYEVDTGEGEFVEQDESCGSVLVVMIGDDRKHAAYISDLTPLADDEYCDSCGQIGCGHDSR